MTLDDELSQLLLQFFGNCSNSYAQNVINIEQHLKVLLKRKVCSGKALWRMYGWSLGNAWMQIRFPNEGQGKEM